MTKQPHDEREPTFDQQKQGVVTQYNVAGDIIIQPTPPNQPIDYGQRATAKSGEKGSFLLLGVVALLALLLVYGIYMFGFGTLFSQATPSLASTATLDKVATTLPHEEPTALFVAAPTTPPVEEPTLPPTEEPATTPTETPTATHTQSSTSTPAQETALIPVEEPTDTPVEEPTATLTESPTAIPTPEPTHIPTQTAVPTRVPTAIPTVMPTPTYSAALTAPEDGANVNGRTTFSWQGVLPFSDRQAVELIFWKPGQDPMENGFGLISPTTESSLTVDLDKFSEFNPKLLTLGQKYSWGLLLVATEPYTRLQFLGSQKSICYKYGCSGGGEDDDDDTPSTPPTRTPAPLPK